ncbi:3-oxoacyl-[acyl-carrier protein] reductase [Pseudonocardia sp. Ae168_Ps1]|uniref:SDR family NAD(P)-dependent oxidoreductase n=1 Tax=unclassified Pseudonocardia TaxID=2619320 RepID=UPI00094AC646|nr:MULTISPECIES: glucose 1-dehydrogenase [unclassified Pseudonocardia]OLL76012.1 3-oxoacyl-[acyl-carrier protein] reductase [Pseudonocardia sp. Ae150A_Ps1]OLL82010.1 3-oxoacyl-[acyl-carrier protein] reductase [Pseudonocardia sp. Ae168_Ps1]OLL83876.1 3-oxoacyl-[acyl-carrier protein] reductase [Pseudonocardia sp. Ae263_Ps1]OLL96105.1 3-oxoacyl-[acyl-carrier protein] reductase [Pseudonocardia sp. Ae356_Ps1]
MIADDAAPAGDPAPPTPLLDLFRLDGKVAVVTGASSGLGAGFAVALAEAGADVVLAARRADRLAETGDAVARHGRGWHAVAADVADPDDCDRVAGAALERFGRVDVLVNNAGISSVVPALREEPGDFRGVLDVNLSGAYWMAQACARRMEPGSAIVNVASVLGLVASALPQAAYSASKAGLLGLTHDLAQQWSGRRGIRVNALAPGFVNTEMTEETPEETLGRFLAGAPLQRLGTQRELDAAMLFLAAPASGYVTGTTLAVDGGMSGH